MAAGSGLPPRSTRPTSSTRSRSPRPASGRPAWSAGRTGPTTLPSLPTRNFSKFHLMSPAGAGLVSSPVRYLYSGSIPSPLTTILDIIGKVTLYLLVQNFSISSFVPGSCLPNSLAGMPMTTSPSFSYFSYSACSPSYCGVSPHLLATFTSSTTLPLYLDSSTGLPLMSLRVKPSGPDTLVSLVLGQGRDGQDGRHGGGGQGAEHAVTPW